MAGEKAKLDQAIQDLSSAATSAKDRAAQQVADKDAVIAANVIEIARLQAIIDSGVDVTTADIDTAVGGIGDVTADISTIAT